MLRKKSKTASSAATVTDESDEHANGVSYGLNDYGDADADAEEGEYDEDADYDETAEYDEDAEYEEDAEYDEDDEYEDESEETEDEEFTPPTAAAAVKRSWMSARPKAQPATGTAEDAQRVNYIDKRERILAYFLDAMLLAIGVTLYFVYRHYVDKSNPKYAARVHADAAWILVVPVLLATMVLFATLSKRRAAVGFTLLLSGVALFSFEPLIGILYLGIGLWMVFRSMRRSPRLATSGARGSSARSARGASTATTRSSGRSTTATTSTRSTASSRSAASSPAKSVPGRTIGRNGRISGSASSGRYTPPKPVRHAAPSVQPEPEPTNRLSAWLKK